MSHDATLSDLPAPEKLPLQLAARLWGIVGFLRQAVAALGGRDRAAVPLVVLAWGRIGRLATRFQALMDRLAAGTLAAPRVRVRVRSGTAAPSAAVRLPRGFAWLVRVLPDAANFGSQLQALLQEPEMAALLASCPRAGRILRPLRRMLGVAEPGAKIRGPRPTVGRWPPPPAVWPPAQAEFGAPAGPVLFPTGRAPPGWDR